MRYNIDNSKYGLLTDNENMLFKVDLLRNINLFLSSFPVSGRTFDT